MSESYIEHINSNLGGYRISCGL